MMNLKRLSILGIAFCATALFANAAYVYKTEKLNDGSTIQYCRFDNGKIDYCTEKDALKAIDVFNHPEKYMNATQKANLEKKKLNVQKAIEEFPIIASINKLQDEYNNNIQQLKNKKSLGVKINEQELELLSYKSDVLYSLTHGYFYDPKTTFAGTYSLQAGYEELLTAKDAKTITANEFESTKKEYINSAKEYELLYSKLIALKSIPSYASSSWIAYNCSNANKLELISPDNIQNAIENKIPDGAKNRFNQLKHTMNSLNDALGTFK